MQWDKATPSHALPEQRGVHVLPSSFAECFSRKPYAPTFWMEPTAHKKIGPHCVHVWLTIFFIYLSILVIVSPQSTLSRGLTIIQ